MQSFHNPSSFFIESPLNYPYLILPSYQCHPDVSLALVGLTCEFIKDDEGRILSGIAGAKVIKEPKDLWMR
jgi:hypothetical protein